MMDEQEMYRLKAVEEGWDSQSCAEFTSFLDDVNEQVADPEPTCAWEVLGEVLSGHRQAGLFS